MGKDEPANICALYELSHGRRTPGRPHTSFSSQVRKCIDPNKHFSGDDIPKGGGGTLGISGWVGAAGVCTAQDRASWRRLTVDFSSVDRCWWRCCSKIKLVSDQLYLIPILWKLVSNVIEALLWKAPVRDCSRFVNHRPASLLCFYVLVSDPGKRPLRNVSTLSKRSPQHVLQQDRCKSLPNKPLLCGICEAVILVSQLTPLHGPLTLEVILSKKRLFNQVILPESILSMPSFICRKLLQATLSTNLSHSPLLKQILVNEKLSLHATTSGRSLTRVLTASDKWNKCLT